MNGNEEKSSWWVPISFTTNKILNFTNTRPQFWLKGQYEIEEDVDLGDWYLLNLDYTGIS